MAAGAANSLSYSFLTNTATAQENAAETFWTADISKNGALDVWKAFESNEPETESIVKKKISDLKRVFHNGRQLWIKHLPRDVTEKEVRDFLQSQDLAVRYIQISCSGPGSSWARVNLAEPDPQLWEEWPGTRDIKSWTIRGHRIHVSPSPTDHMLCVARLPRHLADDDFKRLVESYGETRRCFLVRSQKTGESKGYGLVEFVSKDSAFQARNQLEGRSLEDHVLVCDWLDSSITTFAGLQSKLLYVDHLPTNYRDMGEFRRLFSTVTNPPYCQIALKGGAPQDWGLVEFSRSEEAEDTLKALDGYLLHGSQIRVAFFIPGIRAINIYMKLLNDQNKAKAALFPEPPTDTVFQQLQNLTKQNPAFVHSLQNIIASQLQTLSSTPAPPPAPNSANLPNQISKLSRGRGPSPPLVGHAPTPALAPPPLSQNHTQATLAANAQAALSMILAAQQQANSTTPQPVPPPALQRGVEHSLPNYRPLPSSEINLSVPPPPLYAQPPPQMVQQQPNISADLQKNLSSLLGSLNNAVQPQAVQQAAAGALIGILLQLIQGNANTTPQQPPVVDTFNTAAAPPPLSSPGNNWSHFLSQVRQNGGGPSSLGSAGSRGSSPTSSSPSTSPGRNSTASNSSGTSSGICLPSSGFITPIGSKRKYSHVLPSPEPSPENGYIGQHSQGLGGHYAESYLKRKKRN